MGRGSRGPIPLSRFFSPVNILERLASDSVLPALTEEAHEKVGIS